MSGPPDPDLFQWRKAELVSEVKRLRAILYEHGEQSGDPPTSGGNMVDVAGDPHARGGVVIDARNAVLMDELDVCLVDTKQNEPPAMLLMIQGRVNYQTRRTRQAFLFGSDGAAGLATQLIALAGRAGGRFAAEFIELFEQRMAEMP